MSTGHFFGVRYHRHMLKDSVRTEGYRRAINAVVRPGDVVVDVGAGTGVMSIFAARAGARRVFAIESTPIARLARQIIEDNGLSDIISVIEADAATVSLPEPADVLVTECMGNFVYSDAMLGVLARCSSLLKPSGTICPRRITVHMAPTCLEPIFGEFSFWQQPRYGIDFRAAQHAAVNDVYNVRCPSMQLLMAAPAMLGEVVPTQSVPTLNAAATFVMERPGVVDTLLGWFDAELAADQWLQTGPGQVTHWGQQAFSIPPCKVDVGGTLQVQVSVSRGVMDLPTHHWSGSYTDPTGRMRMRFTHSQDHRFAPAGGHCERWD